MKQVKTLKEFKKVWESEDRLVVKFTADWCGPCKMLAPIIKKVEGEDPRVVGRPEVTFIEVDIDGSEEMNTVTDMMNVRSVPTLFFVKDGVIVKRTEGLISEETLKKHLRLLK